MPRRRAQPPSQTTSFATPSSGPPAGETRLFTSNYRSAGRHALAVAISRGVPVWFRGRHYDPLKPPRSMLRLSGAAFARVYTDQVLSKLDPHRVVEELGDGAVLLCWEAPGRSCHRRLVAAWLTRSTGHPVPEWRYKGVSATTRTPARRPRGRCLD